MEQTDLELEQRVWQRVAGNGRREEQGDMMSALRLAEEAAAGYRRLTRDAVGPMREKLMGLQQRSAEDAAAIRGMMILAGEDPGTRGNYELQRESGAMARAYRRSVRLRDSYAGLSSHEEYGRVFDRMKDRETENQAILLGLIGK